MRPYVPHATELAEHVATRAVWSSVFEPRSENKRKKMKTEYQPQITLKRLDQLLDADIESGFPSKPDRPEPRRVTPIGDTRNRLLLFSRSSCFQRGILSGQRDNSTKNHFQIHLSAEVWPRQGRQRLQMQVGTSFRVDNRQTRQNQRTVGRTRPKDRDCITSSQPTTNKQTTSSRAFQVQNAGVCRPQNKRAV